VAGGPGLSHAYFHPFFSILKDSFQLIYFDAFGCGKSGRDDSTKAYSMAGDVEIIEGLRKTLKLDKIILLGHSYGGFVAQLYALKYGSAVKHLILCNTIASGKDMQLALNNLNFEFRQQFPERWEEVMKLRKKGFLSSSPDHQQAFNIPGTLHNFYNPDNRLKMPVAEPDLYNPDLWYAIAGKDADFVVTNELRRFDVKEKLKSQAMPVLFLAGRFDRNVSPSLTTQYKRLMPKAEFIMLEQSGHFPFLEEPEKTMSIIRRFLSDVGTIR
jgi:proline iminopeptidase